MNSSQIDEVECNRVQNPSLGVPLTKFTIVEDISSHIFVLFEMFVIFLIIMAKYLIW